jgi:hypothetical protein
VKLTMDESQGDHHDRMANQQVGMVACAGWTCRADHPRSAPPPRRSPGPRHRPEAAVPGQRQRRQTLEDAVQRLDAFAKDTGCHVIIVGQINRERANGTFPVPGLADIKDCAELGNGPDNVLFVWREQDPETLDPLDTGSCRMAKYRGARLETVPATFTGEFQRWDERVLVAGEQAA